MYEPLEVSKCKWKSYSRTRRTNKNKKTIMEKRDLDEVAF